MAKAQLRERFTRPLLSLRGVAFVSIAAIAVLCAACLSVLLQTRLELVRRADTMAGNVLVLADQTVEIEIGRYDTRLFDIVTDLHDAATGGAGSMPPGGELFGGAALRNSFGDIIVVGAHGTVLTSSRPNLTPQYGAALTAILAEPEPGPNGVSVSTILLGGKVPPLIAVVRRCLPGACGPAAAAVAILPMSWIQGVFDGIVLGRYGAIALVDSSGILLARQPAIQSRVGHPVERLALIARIPRGRLFLYMKRSTVDGVRRRITAGWVGALPLIVFVGISTVDILSGWSHLAFVIIFAVVVLSGGLAGLTLLLAREVHRKMQVDRQLLSANTQLAELARTDGLTGLLNRRGFDETLAREWRRCRRTGTPISLLMLDADHFKAYNDRFGHPAGDGVLRALGACILGCIRRPGDTAARYGGEEFTVVLPDTDLAGAGAIAEAIRAGIATLAIPHAQLDAMLTVSIGVSSAPPDGSGGADDLVAMADAALYESKATGRNRVTVRSLTPRPADVQAPA